MDAADVLLDPPGVLADYAGRWASTSEPAMLLVAVRAAGHRRGVGTALVRGGAAFTGFAPYDPAAPVVPDRLRELVERARPYYEELAAARIR